VVALLAAVFLSSLSFGIGLARDPYVGVACPGANSTVCGRVGIALWLARRHAIRVEATLAGVHVRLTPPKEVGSYWVGFVHLPLRQLGLPRSWAGDPAKRLTLVVRIHYPGAWRTARLRVDLHAGWG
jgi:hypothetical protein